MTLAALARGIEIGPLACGHVRSQVAILDTSHGGPQPWCLGCTLAFVPSAITSMAALLSVDGIVMGPGARLHPSCSRDQVMCECRCQHAGWTPCRTAAIADGRLLCPGCMPHAAA